MKWIKLKIKREQRQIKRFAIWEVFENYKIAGCLEKEWRQFLVTGHCNCVIFRNWLLFYWLMKAFLHHSLSFNLPDWKRLWRRSFVCWWWWSSGRTAWRAEWRWTRPDSWRTKLQPPLAWWTLMELCSSDCVWKRKPFVYVEKTNKNMYVILFVQYSI